MSNTELQDKLRRKNVVIEHQIKALDEYRSEIRRLEKLLQQKDNKIQGLINELNK